MYIMIYGNPIDGFCYVGPFANRDEALTYAEGERDPRDWWIVELDAPAGSESDD